MVAPAPAPTAPAAPLDPELGAVAAWAAGLGALVARVSPCFARAEPRRRALAYLQGLLSPVARKNGWQLAEAAGDRAPYGVQHLLGRAVWDAEAARDALRAYVLEHLGDPTAVLVIDETGFLKKGTKSVGVQRQYSGTAGRIENCQVGVFLLYAGPRGAGFIDRALYLPEGWTADPARCRAAGVPADIGFATKPELARRMVERALDAGAPAAWVAGDELYGGDRRLRLALEARSQAHVLGVRSNERVWADLDQRPVAELAAALPAEAWQRLSAGDGAKGPRWYDWAWVRLADPLADGWARWLLVRRSLDEAAELAYYVAFGPDTTALADLVRVAGTRWTVEAAFEAAKGEVGLDQYEVRRWEGWHRHVTLALLAHAFLVVTRATAAAPSPPSLAPRPSASSLGAFRARRGLGCG